VRVVIALTVALVLAVVLAYDPVDDEFTNARPRASGVSTTTSRVTATSTTTTTTTTLPPPPTTTTAPPAPPPPPGPPPEAALCVGDSVMLAASTYGVLTMCAGVDATVSRQASEGPAAVQAHAPYPSAVVIHLGTNGTVNTGDLDAMMAALQGVPTVVLVTVQLNGLRSWEDQANGAIVAAADRWPNARLADWKAASNGHPEYFREDGFHPTLEGAQAYANVITSAS
jgi:hypothetical protein